MSDVALTRRVLAGDEAAFEEFFASYFPRLYRFALGRVCGNEDTAEEIVQCVLIRALDRLHTYRGEAALFTWLCVLCRHEVAEWRERAGRRADVFLLDDSAEVRNALEALADAADPEAQAQRRELSALVQLTLEYLPARYGEVLEWKYIHELSVEEIAKRLGLGYKAAESMLSRARASFREGFSVIAGEWSDPRTAGTSRQAEGT
jgi:RNA polymerase sigma-70 factor (ECF subfamily)